MNNHVKQVEIVIHIYINAWNDSATLELLYNNKPSNLCK